MTRLTEKKRLELLDAVLAQIPFDGWTQAALDRGAKQIKLRRGEVQLLFPQGMRDVIDLFGQQADAAMTQAIEGKAGYARMRTRDKIAFAIRARFEYLQLHRDAVRRLLVWYALPTHVPLALRRGYHTVDTIWRAAGDTSTDFNFYTKRLLLAGVLKATLLFWLSDDSPGCGDSWIFLDRRLNDVLNVGKRIGLLKQWLPMGAKYFHR